MSMATNATDLSIIQQQKFTIALQSKNNPRTKDSLYPQISNLLTSMPAYVDWKDADSIYLGSSEQTALRLAGLSSSKDIIGRLDTDLDWGKNEDYETYRRFFLEPDKLVLKGDSIISLGQIVSGSSNQYKTVIIKKIPLLNLGNEIMGIISYLIDISGCAITNVLTQLKNMGINLTPTILSEAKKYTINNQINTLSLSKREEQCLYYLLRNYTAKQIAKVLNLSHRTVESYLNNLKDKFNCINKTTLIIKAMEMQAFNLIPDDILAQQYLSVTSTAESK